MNASTLRNMSCDELVNVIEADQDAMSNPYVVALLNVVRYDWETDELLAEKDAEIEERLSEAYTLECALNELEDQIVERDSEVADIIDEVITQLKELKHGNS